jgi:hypothetical protein
MTMTLTLGDLTARTGLDVLGHLEREMTIPVINGPQAQGDLIVIPLDFLADITTARGAHWRDVPGTGIDVLRAAAAGNPHTLVADPGTCRWTTGVRDPTGLALGALTATSVAYLVHPEHGASGIAPGSYVIRRQRERSGRLGQDRRYQFIVD